MASQTGGVKPMSIAGRLVNERERLLGMTDAERAFRKQWLKDQELAPNEPKTIPEIYKATYNPIRRFYRWPMDQVERALTPLVGSVQAQALRMFTSKMAMGVVITYWLWYNYKYHGNTWEKKGGFRTYISRVDILPGDPGYPCPSTKTKGSDYASRGFDKVTLNLKAD